MSDRDRPFVSEVRADPAPVGEGLTVGEIDAQAEVYEGGENVIAFARAKLSPYLPAYLERIGKEASKGGRRTDAASRLYADIMGLRQKVEILNLFVQRLGVDEGTARAAIEMKRRLEAMDEDSISDMIARSLGQYMKRRPERAARLVRLMEIDDEAISRQIRDAGQAGLDVNSGEPLDR